MRRWNQVRGVTHYGLHARQAHCAVVSRLDGVQGVDKVFTPAINYLSERGL